MLIGNINWLAFKKIYNFMPKKKKKTVKKDKAKAQVGLIRNLKIPESGVPHSAKLISVCSLCVYEVRRLIRNMPQHIHG